MLKLSCELNILKGIGTMKKLIASLLLILTLTVSLLLFSCGGGGVDGDEFQNVAVTDDGILSWTALNRATKYEVLNGKFGTGAPSEETKKPSFDLKKFNLTSGEHEITLLAIGKDPDLGVEAEFAVYEAVVTVTDGVYSIRSLTFSDEYLSLKNFEDADGVITNYIKPQFYSDLAGATYTSLAKEIKINGDNVWGLYSDSEYKSEVASQTITGLKRGHNYSYIKLNDRNGTFLRGYKLDFYILDKIDVKLYSALGSELATFSVWERDPISVADLYSKVPSDSYIAIGSKVIERGAGTVKPLKGDSFREISSDEYKCLIHFDLSSDGVLTAKEGHDTENCTEEEIVIPKTILGREVKVLGNGDYRNPICKAKKITLPEGLVSISDYAFNYSLVSVNIPDSVTYVGPYAFDRCRFDDMDCIEVETEGEYTRLFYIGKWLVSAPNGGAIREGTVGIAHRFSNVNIKLPDSLRYFGERVFESCDLKGSSYSETENGFIYNGKFLVGSTDELASGAQIREDTVGIMRYALSRSYRTDEFIIPAGVRYIHTNAFGYGATDIGSLRVLTDAFRYENGILIDKDMTRICYISKNVTRLIIPDSVTEVCEGTYAEITELHIGANVKTKLPVAFDTAITVSPQNKRFIFKDGILYYWSDRNSPYRGALIFHTVTKSVSGNIEIPEGVTQIPSNAFKENSSLTGVTLPESLTEIGYSAFEGTSVTSITIPANVTRIGNDAFIDSALTEITFADTNGWKYQNGTPIDVTDSAAVIAHLKNSEEFWNNLKKDTNN